MRSYRELERDLLHIKAAIALLEQTRAYLSLRGPVDDPAYWKAKIRQLTSEWPRDRMLERQAADMMSRLENLAPISTSNKT
jgi:hypothetical protein